VQHPGGSQKTPRNHEPESVAADSDPSPFVLAAESPAPDEQHDEQHDELQPAELITRHQRGVWRYLRMLGCDSSTADDLTQETFLRVLRREDFVQHSDAATSSYLRRTAYNLLVSNHRKQKRVQTVAEPAMVDEIWDRWAGKDVSGDVFVEALKSCMTTLTGRARLALRMRFAEEATRVEIAEALQISDHGARNLMQRAKGQLRQCVEAKLKHTSL